MKLFNFKKFCTLLRKDKIKSILTQSFTPSYLEIINESYKHNMPSDYETHLKVTIVSDNCSRFPRTLMQRALENRSPLL